MPHLYPPSLDHLDSRFSAEKEVFARMVVLDDSYHVFHSVTWKDSRDGECDLIIFNELKGFIALEVKGGGVNHNGAKWTSTDRHGTVNPIHDPVKQARDAMFAVKRTWKDRYGTEMPGAFSWAVCFPDCRWNPSCRTLDLDEHAVLDSKGLDGIKPWIERQFAEQEKRHGTKLLSKEQALQFLDLFGKTMAVPLALNRAIVRQEEELLVTGRMQDYLLDLFDDKPRIGFQGAAGTGKTWIAMKKARRLADEGKTVLFLTYNLQVNDFISERLHGVEAIAVHTFHAFAQRIIREYLKDNLADPGCRTCFFSCIGDIAGQAGKSSEDADKKGKKEPALDTAINGALHFLSTLPDDMSCAGILKDHGADMPAAVREVMGYLLPDGKGDYYADRMPIAVMSIFEADKAARERFHYDALIIDEAQDFHKNWCECLKYLFLEYGERTCYIFYDDNQTIFTKEKELPVTGLIASAGLEDHIFKLRDNLRNTAAIHDYAVNKTGKGATARPFEIPGIVPNEVTVKGDAAARSAVGAILKELIETHGIKRDRIVILSNRSMEKSIFADKHDQVIGDYTLTDGSGVREGIRFRTIQKFKGLESDVVIAIIHRREQEKEARYQADELLYVGYTRAKHLLYVVEVV